MATLNGTTPASTYPSLIKFDNNSAISAALRLLSDGAGGATPIYLSSTQMNIGGTGLIDARLGVKGTGATSATKTFRSENSTGTTSFEMLDNGRWNFNVGGDQNYVTNFGFFAYRFSGNSGSSYLNLESVCDLYDVTGTLGIRVNSAFTGIAKPTSVGQTSAPVASAVLEAVSTTRGFLPPRMTNAQILAIATPAAGLMAYNTTLGQPCFYDGAAWNKLNHSPM